MVKHIGKSSGRIYVSRPQGYIKICSTQLSMEFFQLINVGILAFYVKKSSILDLSEPEKS